VIETRAPLLYNFAMKRYVSSFGSIELTDERLGHILTFHPEIRTALKHFDNALSCPDFTKASRRDPNVVVFYRGVSKTKSLAIVAKIVPVRFILTAYFITNSKTKHENKDQAN
jgi:hypothetical protein